MFWTKQIPKILQARPRKFTGEGLEKMQHCVQGQATSPTTGLVSGGQFLAHLPNSFCTSIKNLKIFFNPKSTSVKVPCKIRQSSMKYTGLLDYWDEWLIDQLISLFFYKFTKIKRFMCPKNYAKKYCLEHHQTLGWWVVCPFNPVTPGYHIEDCRILPERVILSRKPSSNQKCLEIHIITLGCHAFASVVLSKNFCSFIKEIQSFCLCNW